MAAFDWSHIRFTEHMTEAAAMVAECQVVLDFGPAAQVAYEIKVYESLKGGGAERYFAVGINRDDPQGFRPVGGAATAEEALQACLSNAGIHHRRRVKQADEGA
jgi:hypothetical protein